MHDMDPCGMRARRISHAHLQHKFQLTVVFVKNENENVFHRENSLRNYYAKQDCFLCAWENFFPC